jgi:hypothetical protein
MPEFPFHVCKWGNVVQIAERQEGNRTVITVLAVGTRAQGDFEAIEKAVQDAKSEDDFARICKERGLLAPPAEDGV